MDTEDGNLKLVDKVDMSIGFKKFVELNLWI